jgi:hypothetical protein
MEVSFRGIQASVAGAVKPMAQWSAVLRCGANLLRRRFACAHMAGRM